MNEKNLFWDRDILMDLPEGASLMLELEGMSDPSFFQKLVDLYTDTGIHLRPTRD